MHPMRKAGIFALALVFLASLTASYCSAQGALLMEEPYGFFGTLNPTGHTAIYLERVCAETPVSLRRCHPGELGSVISRYQGIKGYDWIAIPLVPYLYSVESPSQVPSRVDPQTVRRLRDLYHEKHLDALGRDIPHGGFLSGGWTQLIGVSYERRIYAFRFNTSAAQDDLLIADMNAGPNKTRFNLLFNNCADFARNMMDIYYPGVFSRSIFPDAGMTTPRQIAWKLTRYARQHPEVGLAVYEIPQISGNHRGSRSNKSIAGSLITTVYAVPLAVVNPYLAGGLFVDYLVRGRFHHLVPRHLEKVGPKNLAELTAPSLPAHNPSGAGFEAASAAAFPLPPAEPGNSSNPGLTEGASHNE
ncbi:MAG: hypothetical protein P4L03_06935 [Terracidiphilus sp.]|nr:hypothetical protein [Terracidiphilus sp.]